MRISLCTWALIWLANVGTLRGQDGTADKCDAGSVVPKRYLLYEVNSSEGFNLRRDVYMRMASLARQLQQHGDWTLILPPWGDLYHWKSNDITQVQLPWSLFFDVPSLRKYTPVLELADVLKEYKHVHIDTLYYLQHYAEGWKDGKWEEKLDERPCIDNPPYMYGHDRSCLCVLNISRSRTKGTLQ